MRKVSAPHVMRFVLVMAGLVTSVWLMSRILFFLAGSNGGNPSQSFSRKNVRAAKDYHYYNLILEPHSAAPLLSNIPCNQEYANKHRLQQDHPCVIQLIRRKYLYYPSPPDVSLSLEDPTVVDPSAGQSAVILPLLNNKTGGFFAECGALDGEYNSNTLYMERSLEWDGVLIEANQKEFSQLLARKRKAYAVPVCLSQHPYPTEVIFHEDDVAGKIENSGSHQLNKSIGLHNKGELVKRQCFPFYSILLAIGRTRVDYFSLDVEGSESLILKTIPWHRVDIRALTVEVTSRKASDVEALTQFMDGNGYEMKSLMDGIGFYDLVFLKKDLQDKSGTTQ